MKIIAGPKKGRIWSLSFWGFTGFLAFCSEYSKGDSQL